MTPQAVKVPLGMAVLGFFSSPDTLAPAMIPVTPANNTAKTLKKMEKKIVKTQQFCAVCLLTTFISRENLQNKLVEKKNCENATCLPEKIHMRSTNFAVS